MKKNIPKITIKTEIDLDPEKVRELKKLMKEKGIISTKELRGLIEEIEKENSPSLLTH